MNQDNLLSSARPATLQHVWEPTLAEIYDCVRENSQRKHRPPKRSLGYPLGGREPTDPTDLSLELKWYVGMADSIPALREVNRFRRGRHAERPLVNLSHLKCR